MLGFQDTSKEGSYMPHAVIIPAKDLIAGDTLVDPQNGALAPIRAATVNASGNVFLVFADSTITMLPSDTQVTIIGRPTAVGTVAAFDQAQARNNDMINALIRLYRDARRLLPAEDPVGPPAAVSGHLIQAVRECDTPQAGIEHLARLLAFTIARLDAAEDLAVSQFVAAPGEEQD
jgi:hypothetical protein